jgi:hypothetical protein
MSTLRQLHADLWVCRVPYRAMGMPLGRQLVVVRLPSGGLWIHSPIPLTADLRRELAALGSVQHVMAPNLWHDECLREFQAEQPAALFHAAPGLAARKKDVRFGAELSDTAHPEWAAVIDQHLVRGMPAMNEVVFFHRPSRSLIIADLAFNFGLAGAGEPPVSRWFAWMMRAYGCWQRFGPTPLEKFMMRDRAAVRTSIDRILAWDFQRVIVGHGDNVETDARARFAAAFAFLR